MQLPHKPEALAWVVERVEARGQVLGLGSRGHPFGIAGIP